MVAHVVEVNERTHAFEARCACGWHSRAVASRERSEALGSMHVDTAGAQARARAAEASRLRCRERGDELRAEQRRLRDRRTVLARRRDELPAALVRATSPILSTPRYSGPLLRRALELAGRSPEHLWLAQLSLGGRLEPAELDELLAGVRPVMASQHDVLATALNEWFHAAGLGRPVSHWQFS